MKKLMHALAISITIVSCTKTNTNNTTKTQIDSLLNNWHKAAANANYTNYFNAMDRVSVFVGTDAAEVWNKKQFSSFSKPFFDNGKAWSFSVLQRNVYFSENKEIVWFDELLDTWMGLCRGSGVLEFTDGTWKIKHYVLSMTIPNDNINDIIKINKEKDSIYKQKLKK